jgi:type 2 lantibiotic biosynthesis protein LanM
MLDNLSLVQIACYASNLSERLIICEKLSNCNAISACHIQLNPMDSWAIDKLAGKLAVTQVKQELYQQLATQIPSKLILTKQLKDYKLHELNINNLSEVEQAEFVKPHQVWLQVYKEALATLELPNHQFNEYSQETHYEHFGIVCEPFLRWLQQKLEPVFTSVNYKVNTEVLADIQLELINRFERLFAHALEADINFYCHQNNIPKSTEKQAYIRYLHQTFHRDRDSVENEEYEEQKYHKFFCKFPVLGRQLAQVTYFFGEIVTELLQHINNDLFEISDTFFNGSSIEKITSISLGNSDSHAGGHTVVMINLELANSKSETLVYKPRCIQSEAAMQSLLTILTNQGVVKFGNYRLLCKDGYGYVEFLIKQNHTGNQEIVNSFYRQLGGYLAIFHILGGSDLHFENILVSNCNPFICDCETILEVVPHRTNKHNDTLYDSVFSTGMLDWPLPDAPDAEKRISMSGYNGGDSYIVPFAVPRIINRMSLALAVEYQTGIEIKGETSNRIYYQGKLVAPQAYKEYIVDGFNQVYNWVQQNSSYFINLVTDLFTVSSVRFVNRATQIYAHLLTSGHHAKCLVDPLEVDLVFHTLIEHPRMWDDKGKLAELEIAALWQLDTPIFTAKANSQELIFNEKLQLPDPLAISPLDNAIQRIKRLSPESQMRQNQYIYTSLSAGEINNPYFIESAVDYAYQIGKQLCSLLEDENALAPWKTTEFTATGLQLTDINASLHTGSAGICLFLAYLDSIRPEPEFRQAAQRALTHAINSRDHEMIGAFQGKAGLIYLLTHLAQLWQQPQFLELALNLCDEFLPLISQDNYYDIINGVSGVIPVMLGLADAAKKASQAINCAKICAEHLMQNAICTADTLAWSYKSDVSRGSLTGFSHGVAGIGWALIRYGVYTNQDEYIEAGHKAFAYEATQFDSTEGNWYDLRTSVMTTQAPGPKFAYYWCSGAAGIALSRIDSWATLGKSNTSMFSEAQIGLDTTLRTFNQLTDDSLCHGRSGNSEVLLRFALLQNQPYLQMEANAQATTQWRLFEKSRRWTCGAGGSEVLPELMNGLAGIGMHFLRLAHPQLIPSPLLLDAPPQQLQQILECDKQKQLAVVN